MGKINLGKKLTVILCVVLCCVQTTGCDKKAVKEQAAQIAQNAKRKKWTRIWRTAMRVTVGMKLQSRGCGMSRKSMSGQWMIFLRP